MEGPLNKLVVDIQLMKSKNLIDNIWTAEDGRPPPTAKVS